MSPRVAALVVAAGFVAAGLSGRASLLVRPWFVPVLVVTGVAAAWAARHVRGGLSARTAYLLLLPVAVGVIVTPALAGRAAQDAPPAAGVTARVGDGANPLVSGGSGRVTLLQILLAQQQVGNVALSGRPVTVEAISGGPHLLRRSVIVCCAADARSIALGETGPALPGRGTWLRVRGVLTAEGNSLVLAADRVDRIATPPEPFL